MSTDAFPTNPRVAAAAKQRLDEIATEHPELLGPTGPENVEAWIDTIGDDEKGPGAMSKEGTTQVAFRFPDALIERLDRHAARMSKQHPGMTYTRADAVRTLLFAALDEAEADAKRGGK